MAGKPSSDTMEINSILAEARSRNQSLSASKKPAQRGASAPKAAARTSAPSSTRKKTVDDGFVDISNSGSYHNAARKTEAQPKKSKKPLVIGIVVVLVLALAGVGGFMWFRYQHSGSSEVVADKVTVNGVSIGGMTIDEAKKAMAGIEQSLADGIKVQVKAADKDFTLTKDDYSYTFNTDEVLAQVKAYSEQKSLSKSEKNFDIKMTVDTSGTQAIAENIAKEVYQKPANARVSAFDSSADNMFTFEDGVVGRKIDPAVLTNQINGVFQSGKTAGEIDAEVETVEPKISAKYLAGHIVKLSSFSTYSTNNSNGNENMRVSLAACDSSIIEPGETWSFNECTGDSNKESNGYLPAGVIIQGRSETGIGGGICQSSTTIYNAGLLCGMNVIERACHYYKSTYVDAGRDATIDYGNIDLKLENPFNYQLFMKCWMDGTELNCEMYGLENPNFDEIKISTSDPDYFATGYTVKAWRTYYKNGKEVDEDDLPKSTYYTVAPKSDSDSDSNSNSNRNDNDDDDDDDSGSSSAPDSGSSSAPDSGSSTPGDGGNVNPGDGGNVDPGDGGNVDPGDGGEAEASPE